MVQLMKKTKAALRSCFYVTFGIHPWYADRWNPDDWLEYYKNCPMIGEIGMDNLWCDVPLNLQQKVLEKQLRTAVEMKKPVVLHTKGCEARIAQIIKDFPYPVLVHWYSGDSGSLRLFLDLGCFFTLGPDTGLYRTAVQDHILLKNVPSDHLFTETDGLDAIMWAYETAGKNLTLFTETDGQETAPRAYESAYETAGETAAAQNPYPEFSVIGQTLEASAECIALRFSLTAEEVTEQINQNLAGLLSSGIL